MNWESHLGKCPDLSKAITTGLAVSRHSLRTNAWVKLTKKIIERDGHQCVRCGATTDLTVDHIVSLDTMTQDDLDDGLDTDPDNLQTLCRSCNARKSNRPNDNRKTWLNPQWFN